MAPELKNHRKIPGDTAALIAAERFTVDRQKILEKFSCEIHARDENAIVDGITAASYAVGAGATLSGAVPLAAGAGLFGVANSLAGPSIVDYRANKCNKQAEKKFEKNSLAVTEKFIRGNEALRSELGWQPKLKTEIKDKAVEMMEKLDEDTIWDKLTSKIAKVGPGAVVGTTAAVVRHVDKKAVEKLITEHEKKSGERISHAVYERLMTKLGKRTSEQIFKSVPFAGTVLTGTSAVMSFNQITDHSQQRCAIQLWQSEQNKKIDSQRPFASQNPSNIPPVSDAEVRSTLDLDDKIQPALNRLAKECKVVK